MNESRSQAEHLHDVVAHSEDASLVQIQIVPPRLRGVDELLLNQRFKVLSGPEAELLSELGSELADDLAPRASDDGVPVLRA